MFNISLESDTTDINFWVRAVDNDGNRDPSPAYLRVPIRNTPPTIKQDSTVLPRDTTHLVLTFGITPEDADGFNTITRVEFKLNDGSWNAIPPETEVISLVPTAPEATGSVSAEVYLGADEFPQAFQADNYRLNDTNTVYLRATDEGGLESIVDTAGGFYVTNKTADLLAFDAHSGFPIARDYYESGFENVWGAVDYIDADDTTNFSRAGNINFRLWIALYEQLAWLDDASSQDKLSAVSTPLEEYVNTPNSTKRLLLVTNLPDTIFPNSLYNRIGVLDNIVLDSTAAVPSSANNGEINGSNGYPDISSNSMFFIQPIKPIFPGTAEPIYTADLVEVDNSPWTDQDVLATRTRNQQNNVNVVFSAVEIHRLENQTGLEAFLQQVYDDFNW